MHILIALMLLTPAGVEDFAADKERLTGFFDLYWDEVAGKLYLGIDRLDEPFLLVESLATGLGSNDLSLDRGQLGRNRLVVFRRVGQQVFLEQPNLLYRAYSDNAAERRAVAESFAYSILWSAKIEAQQGATLFVDLGSLAIRDEKGVARRLADADEGAYTLDEGRCHYFMERTRSFPDNTEIEVALTFRGRANDGGFVNDVTPSPEAITLRQHISLIRLPDDDYKAREYHPNSGAFPLICYDYAAPLAESLERRWVFRHRMVPGKPLIYYVDSGAPPEIRQALIDGALWWAEAFAVAGFPDSFQVKVLPPDADPMDVRYNVIQWVHRATRGWSYGGSIADPRTGEIIKGHVTLGSLRVRQDRLLFEGMIPVDARQQTDPVALALARIRQLSAHEVGHTLGLAHNFAASTYGRTSVMDYPAPLVRLGEEGLDFSDVYGVGVGAWDIHAIGYLYAQFEQESQGLAAMITAAEKRGLKYVADADSRPLHSLHPAGHLWDNGTDALAEFERIVALRSYLLANFSTANLGPNRLLAELEEILVPIYLYHRYQLVACSKVIGGASFDYGANDGQTHYQVVSQDRQRRALVLILRTLEPDFLALPDHLRDLIPPRPPGYPQHRELFGGRTGKAFDEIAITEAAVNMTLQTLLAPARINRLFNQKYGDPAQLGAADLVESLLAATCRDQEREGRSAALHRLINHRVVEGLVGLVRDTSVRADVRAETLLALRELAADLKKRTTTDRAYLAHYLWQAERIGQLAADEEVFKGPMELPVPPGSPIGSGPH